MTPKQEGATATPQAMSYDLGHPHAVSALGYLQVAYDNDGNIFTVAPAGGYQESFAYDVGNRLVLARQWSSWFLDTAYLYDGSGELARRRTTRWNGGGVDTKETYVDGIYQETSTGCGASAGSTKQYMAFGRVFAIRQNGVMKYQLTDHLNSAAGSVDESGTVSATVKFYPFGAPRPGSGYIVADYGFTGQRAQAASTIGAYYYHARFYSPLLAHFMSADPTAGGGLNRYAYGYGNPLAYDDPTGLDPTAPTSEDISSCAADLISCVTWTMLTNGIKTNSHGLILVGGRGATNVDGQFSALIAEFLGWSNVGCDKFDCTSLVEALVGLGADGQDAAYELFGVRFIPTTTLDGAIWSLKYLGGAQGPAYYSLASALSDTSKNIIGVVGFSLGASIVGQFYDDHQNVHTPYFLIEACCNPFHDFLRELRDSRFAGDYPFRPSVEVHPGRLFDGDFPYVHPKNHVVEPHHDPHNDPESASHILDSLRALDADPARGEE